MSTAPRETYQTTGFYIHPEPIVPASLIRQALDRVPAVTRGEYDLGNEPWRRWNVGDPCKMQKIDQVHLCDRAFHSLSTQPSIGEWVARITQADVVQIWATQLFVKPSGGGPLGAIGWHTDRENWLFWEGEVMTVWLPLVDVGPASGPLLYVAGSHLWPNVEKQGDAYAQDLDQLENRLKEGSESQRARDWRKVPVLLDAGCAAFHSADTLHGSAANESATARIALGINVRTERSRIRPGVTAFGYDGHLHDPFMSPTIFRRTS